MTRGAVAALAALASLACAGAAGAVPRITADPPLKPRFKGGTADYTVRCRRKRRVRISVDAPPGTRVAVDGGPARSGRFRASVRLAPGQALVMRVRRGARKRTRYVRCLPGDFPRWSVKRASRPTARWFVVTPSHKRVVAGYIAVFDEHGVPVWWMRGDPPPFDGKVLPNGNLAWTRWVYGRPQLGYHEEHSLDGGVVRRYGTAPGRSNPHELRVLPNGNYVMVAYRPRDGVDLSPWGGSKNATVLDGELQELDPFGNVLWSWSTADHVAPAETARWYPKLFRDRPVDLGSGRFAYDIAHVNSIERVGNRVVTSLRHTDAVYAVDMASGEIAWKLGGTRTPRSLRILGDPHGAAELGGQHDARASGGGTALTLHENGTRRGRPPRALAFRIDQARGTATLVRSIRFGRARRSASSGSARRLPGGHWVVSWGNIPYVGELTASGRPVLTLHFGGGLFSYRADPVLPGRLSRKALRRGMDAMVAP